MTMRILIVGRAIIEFCIIYTMLHTSYHPASQKTEYEKENNNTSFTKKKKE